MSRIGAVLVTVELPCETASPIHIGTGDSTPLTGSPSLRDASGQLVLPGSSIAGSLRALVRRLYGSKAADDLFGRLAEQENADEGSPSPLWVFDSPLDTESSEIRDGVGIDRATQGPRSGLLFKLEVVPAGTPLALRFLLEADSTDQAKEMLGLLAGALAQVGSGLWAIGGRTSRGFGWVKGDMEKALVRVFDVTTADGAVQLAMDGLWSGSVVEPGTWLKPSDLMVHDGIAPVAMRFTVKARVAEPIAVGGEFRPSLTDIAPVLTGVSPAGDLAYAIPGSTLKGALRSRVEEILRRTAGPDAACDPTAGSRTDSPSCSARLDAALTKPTPEQVTDWVAKNACMACRLFGMGHWRSSTAFKDATISDALAKKFDWIAIDRFTGGPHTSKKFDGTLLTRGEFEFEFVVTEDRLGQDLEAAWLALLAHLLLDLESDGLQLGFGKLRGWGHCEIESVDVVVGASPASGLANLEGALGAAPIGLGWSSRRLDWSLLKTGTDSSVLALRESLDSALTGWLARAEGGRA